jgi:hypothetical protein
VYKAAVSRHLGGAHVERLAAELEAAGKLELGRAVGAETAEDLSAPGVNR